MLNTPDQKGPAMPTQDQIQKLPKWAQQYVAQLERDLSHSRRQYEAIRTTGEQGSPVVIEQYNKPGVPLHPSDTIAFKLPSGTILVQLSGGLSGTGTLQLMARDGALSVRPQSANVVQVKVDQL